MKTAAMLYNELKLGFDGFVAEKKEKEDKKPVEKEKPKEKDADEGSLQAIKMFMNYLQMTSNKLPEKSPEMLEVIADFEKIFRDKYILNHIQQSISLNLSRYLKSNPPTFL